MWDAESREPLLGERGPHHIARQLLERAPVVAMDCLFGVHVDPTHLGYWGIVVRRAWGGRGRGEQAPRGAPRAVSGEADALRRGRMAGGLVGS